MSGKKKTTASGPSLSEIDGIIDGLRSLRRKMGSHSVRAGTKKSVQFRGSSPTVQPDVLAYLKSTHRGGYRGQEELPADLPRDLIVVWYWVSGQKEISDLQLMDPGEAKEYAEEVVNHSSVIVSQNLGRRVDPIKAKDVINLWKWLNR